MDDPGRFEEHMLGPAQADALGPELAGGFRIRLGLGIGADTPTYGPRRPSAIRLAEVAGQFRLDRVDRTFHDLPRRTVQRDHVAFAERVTEAGQRLVRGIDAKFAGTGNARLAHAACDHSRMAGHPATCCQNALAPSACRQCLRGWFRCAPGSRFLPLAAAASASSAVNTIPPLQRPAKPAGRVRSRRGRRRGRASGAKVDPVDPARSAARLLPLLITPSSTISQAIFNAALAGTFAGPGLQHPQRLPAGS